MTDWAGLEHGTGLKRGEIEALQKKRATIGDVQTISSVEIERIVLTSLLAIALTYVRAISRALPLVMMVPFS